jgi:uncharacterized protein
MNGIKFLIGARDSSHPSFLSSSLLNRHGLVTGATGTGKTRTIQRLAELFSLSGIPVILPDVKGDLSGLATIGTINESIKKRIEAVGIDSYTPQAFTPIFWSLGAEGRGHPLRTTVSEIGPLLLSRMLGLNDTQESALTVLFQVADKEGLLLVDTSDLDALLSWAIQLPDEIEATTGSLAKSTITTIKRKLVSSSLSAIVGSPSLTLSDMINRSSEGVGTINLIDAHSALSEGSSYALFLCWLLSEFFEALPEVGDQPLPRLVIFFDEAHLLFKDATPVLRSQIERVIRLIRSKGVSIFFISQNVSDIPSSVLSQLAHRIHHAVRAYTPSDQKDLRALSSTLRASPDVPIEDTLLSLGIGEALVSTLDEEGRPSPAEKIMIAPPVSSMTPTSNETLQKLITSSLLMGKYEQVQNPRSAAEVLAERIKNAQLSPHRNSPPKEEPSWLTDALKKAISGIASSMLRSATSKIGREITRGILGGITKK